MTAALSSGLDLADLRQLALALLLAETRLLVCLDDEVRAALGLRPRRGCCRADDLALRLLQLIDSSPIWRRRAELARASVVSAALAPATPDRARWCA